MFKAPIAPVLAGVVCVALGGTVAAHGATSVVAADLRAPVKIEVTPLGNALVAEAGNGPNTGRISIVDLATGSVRTLIDGLPSGFTPPEGDASGPSGLALRGRTLYIAIGNGDATIANPNGTPTELPNPAPSSPIFSSVLALSFRKEAERRTSGFALAPEDHAALARGEELTLLDAEGNEARLRLVVDIEDHVPAPTPEAPDAVVPSNPFGIAFVGRSLFVADASRDLIWEFEPGTRGPSELVAFPPAPNPSPVGPPVISPVPSSLREFQGGLVTTRLTGFPFPQGAADARRVDPRTGDDTVLVDGLTMAIDALPLAATRQRGILLATLEFSLDPLANGPGRLQLVDTASGQSLVLAEDLVSPTSLALDRRGGGLLVTEIFTGRLLRVTPGDEAAPRRRNHPRRWLR
ncbi:MAG: ScyD/ScyE family protein [Acidobacteria bacterium]|nr:ScyD/ScyE family protein [Acidobacteriota bacterium]